MKANGVKDGFLPDGIVHTVENLAWDSCMRGCLPHANFAFRLMTPDDLLHSLVAVYPPENSKLERSGALKGDRHDMSAQLPEMIKASD